MRHKRQILIDYLKLLNEEQDLGYSEEDIKNKLEDKETYNFVEKQLLDELYGTEEYKGQVISSKRAYMIWCKIVIYMDIRSGRKVC